MWADKSTALIESVPRSGVRNGRWQTLASAIKALCIALLGFVVIIQFLRPEFGAWLILAALLIGAALVFTIGTASRKTAAIMILCLGVALSAINYLVWRTGVVNWSAWWLALPLFIAETFGILHTLGFQYTLWPHPVPQLRPVDDPSQWPIFVFIPTVNEGEAIIRATLEGVLAARARYLEQYPHGQIKIVLCNDGRVAGVANWQAIERLAKELDVICVTRTVGGGAKAGNIENARQQVAATGNALITIFDADQIAKPEFFLKTVPPFADPKIAWVQTGQYYSNRDNIVADWANDQQSLFYQVLCPGKAAQNAAFICGTNVVLRAAALDEIGGLPQDSITEDFAASIQLHPKWRSIFLTDVLATGLGPMTLKSYFKQQKRWATGTLSVFRAHWRDILLPKRNGLTLDQRIQYALACTHYLCGVRDAIYVIVPLTLLITGIAAVRGADLNSFLSHFLPYWLLSQIAFWYAGWRKTSLRGVIIGFGSFPVLLLSAITVVAKRRVGFSVTSKQRTADSVWVSLLPHLIALALCVFGLIVFATTKANQEPMAVTALWVVYTICMFLGVLWIGVVETFAQRSRASAHSPNRQLIQAQQRFLFPRVQRRVTVPAVMVMSSVGVVFAVGTVLTAGNRIALSQPPRFTLAQDSAPPYLGVSLPFAMVTTPISQLDSQLNISIALVGRTQDITDYFDNNWANQLAAHHARPWLTLLFNVAGSPAYTGSLPAIANGVHDSALRRWADSIRDYGKPVYLTILPEVDRNWVLSSAVTNNGIPQDAPRAWQHVQTIFAQENAVNVVWIWAPADPAHDDSYAPPPKTIDIVALTLISYPGTAWADPGAALSAVSARYPQTPILLQISAQGPSEQKAAWLNAVGMAVASTANVYGVVYYNGDPTPNAERAQQLLWAFDSDALSLDAMHRMIQNDTIHPLSN